MSFVALENVLKFDDFSGLSWGHPRSWQCARLGVIGSFPGLITTVPGSLKLRKEYIGYMVHWKQDYSRIPRSLVAPSRGAGGFYATFLPKIAIIINPIFPMILMFGIDNGHVFFTSSG